MIKQILIFDKNISNRLLSTRENTLAHWTAKIGGVVFCSILLFIIILVPQKDKFTLLCNLGLSLGFTTTIVFALKYSIKRSRAGDIQEHFVKKYDPYSFPSGHISRLAAFIIPFYPSFIIIAGIIILILISTWARLNRGYHFLSDIIAGALIGLGCGYCAYLINSYFLVRFLLAIPLIKHLHEWLFIF